MAQAKKKNEDSKYLKPISGGVTAATGFKASAIQAGIKTCKALDLALLTSDFPCTAAGTFTTNKVRASSVDWCESVLPSSNIFAVVCNAGNANACTGAQGQRDTRSIAQAAAGLFQQSAQSALVASTGIIGHFLPMDKILPNIPKLGSTLSAKGGNNFAQAIMTTDTKKKECAISVTLSSGTCVIGGCTKGSGMIHPNMATMLCFITSDAAVEEALLNKMIKRVVERTFNNLTVDGDTSTNDMVLTLSNGASGARVKTAEDVRRFEEGLYEVCATLCKKIAEDGEGATKRVEIRVSGAQTYRDAKRTAKAVANSNLVKTALFGCDPNWGRIVCAVGYSGASFSPTGISVRLCGTQVFKAMRPVAFSAKAVNAKLKGKLVEVDIDLGLGAHAAIAHTCDFSYEYVKINADYHT